MSWDGVHALVQRVKAGDAGAWPPLHALAQDYLLRLAQRLVGPGWAHRSANDLVMDAWLHVCQTIGDFRGGDNDTQTGAMFRAWLKTVLHRLHANGLRHDQAAIRRPQEGIVPLAPTVGPGDSSVSSGDPPANDPTPSHPVHLAERRAKIERVLATLEDRDRAIVKLHFFEGQSLEQVAERLSLTYDQVRYRLHEYILDRLGDELKDLV
jgi:RNA polymerase sigma factor (sigma-70 family)